MSPDKTYENSALKLIKFQMPARQIMRIWLSQCKPGRAVGRTGQDYKITWNGAEQSNIRLRKQRHASQKEKNNEWYPDQRNNIPETNNTPVNCQLTMAHIKSVDAGLQTPHLTDSHNHFGNLNKNTEGVKGNV